MLVEDCGGHAGAAGVFHPDNPCAVVLEGSAEDVALAAVLGEGLAPVGLVVEERFHSDRHEGRGVVFMGPVGVGAGGDLGENVGLPQEKEFVFGLRDGLAPEVTGEVAAVPPRTPTKCSFQVWIAFSAILRRWSSGKTS